MNSVKDRYGNVAAGGMDVHYKFSQVTMRDAQGRVVARERLDHPDRQRLKERLAAWPQDVPFVLEASFGWAWLADLVQELGLTPMLSNCYKVEQMRKARGLGKNNRKDADLLSLLPLEAGDWWKVWMAPPEVRDRREWMRYRTDLVMASRQAEGRIHAVFHRHGVFHNFSDLFGGKGRRFLGELCREGKAPEGPLPPGALAALRGQVRLLDHVRTQLAEVAKRLRKELERTPLARRLDKIPGFGLILVHTLLAEIGRIERFRNQRSLAAYCLLGPICDDTGEEDPSKPPVGRHLGTRGNRTLQWAFVEAAHGAVRHGGRWRAMFDRCTQGGRKNRHRGYIQVARSLVNVVYAIWKNQTEYQDSPPPGPERGPHVTAKEFFGRTRSGTGQPCLAMVVARR